MHLHRWAGLEGFKFIFCFHGTLDMAGLVTGSTRSRLPIAEVSEALALSIGKILNAVAILQLQRLNGKSQIAFA